MLVYEPPAAHCLFDLSISCADGTWDRAACHAHSVYGKAFSVFGRELDMITQDSLRYAP